MSNTVNLLFDAVLKGSSIITPVFVDYFGMNNDQHYTVIYGIYEGLIKYKGISKKLIENCFMTNRLDELIHKKYTYHKSGYYNDFCKKNIKIGNTYYFDKNEKMKLMDIFTDDFCPSCDTGGYYTKNNMNLLIPNAPTDCFKCGVSICKLCSNYDNINRTCLCYKCEHPNIKVSIKNKISGYNRNDMEKFGVVGNVKPEDIVLLLNKQKFKCYVCDDAVLTFGWKPYCLYQFSVDRIDNSLPHNRDNVLISCYYCNCIGYFMNDLDCNENKKYKICDNYCHCEKRDIQTRRENVLAEKINSLKLND